MDQSTTGESRKTILQSAARAAGWSGADVEKEVMRALPEDFVFRYELLWLRAYGRSVGGVVGRDPAALPVALRPVRNRVSTNQTETRGGAKYKPSNNGVGVGISNEHALNVKRRIDRKLRRLARDIKAAMGEDVRAGRRRCTRCHKWAEDTWSFCPYDGARTEEVD